MSEWEECKLGDVAEIQTGPFGSQLHQRDYKVVGTPIITVEHLGENRVLHQNLPLVGDTDKERLKRYIIYDGDIVFSRVGSVDRRAYVSKRENGWMFSGRLLRVRPDRKLVSPKYLSYYFGQEDFKEHIRRIAVGATMPSINTSILSGVDIFLPPLPEQRAIASVLSSLDDKIDLLHRQNKTLEALAETLFRQWFVEDADEGWEEGVLGDVIELVYGKGLRQEVRTGKGYPVVGSSGIVGYHSDFLVNGPGIVIGRKGTLGKVIYLFENFFPIDTTYYIKSKIESAGLLYEYFLLKTLNFEEMNSDSAVPGLNRDIALSTEIQIAPLDKLHKFNKLASAFITKLSANSNNIQTLEKLRDTLLPKLMSGEVRVSY